MHETIITHPANKRYLSKLFESVRGDKQIDKLSGTPIEFLETMPERNIERVWLPPADSRFVGYGPEDEEWMKPLGLGRMVEVDGGPLFCLIQNPAWQGRVAAIYGPATFTR